MKKIFSFLAVLACIMMLVTACDPNGSSKVPGSDGSGSGSTVPENPHEVDQNIPAPSEDKITIENIEAYPTNVNYSKLTADQIKSLNSKAAEGINYAIDADGNFCITQDYNTGSDTHKDVGKTIQRKTDGTWYRTRRTGDDKTYQVYQEELSKPFSTYEAEKAGFIPFKGKTVTYVLSMYDYENGKLLTHQEMISYEGTMTVDEAKAYAGKYNGLTAVPNQGSQLVWEMARKSECGKDGKVALIISLVGEGGTPGLNINVVDSVPREVKPVEPEKPAIRIATVEDAKNVSFMPPALPTDIFFAPASAEVHNALITVVKQNLDALNVKLTKDITLDVRGMRLVLSAHIGESPNSIFEDQDIALVQEDSGRWVLHESFPKDGNTAERYFNGEFPNKSQFADIALPDLPYVYTSIISDKDGLPVNHNVTYMMNAKTAGEYISGIAKVPVTPNPSNPVFYKEININNRNYVFTYIAMDAEGNNGVLEIWTTPGKVQ